MKIFNTMFLLPFFLVLSVEISNGHQLQRRMNEECNDYVDGIINDFKADKEYFEDPYKVQDKTYVLSKKTFLINYTAEASINDGFIYGLATLHRESDVVVDRSKKTHLKVYLGAGEIKMSVSGKVKLMKHGPNVNVDARITYISMKLDIVPNQESGVEPKVVGFDIEETKGLDVKVKGLGPISFFLNIYMKFIGNMFKVLIRKGIETKMQKFLADKFQDYPVPLECLNG